MKPWDVLQQSSKDQHSLDATPVVLCFTDVITMVYHFAKSWNVAWWHYPALLMLAHGAWICIAASSAQAHPLTSNSMLTIRNSTELDSWKQRWRY